MTKNYKWYFETWRCRQMFKIGIEWCAEKSWFRRLTEFDIYLGCFALGWIKMPAPVEVEKQIKKK